jgi:hypothetical protein
VTASTFNARLREPERLKRLFALAHRIAALVPAKSLSYPRDLARLPQVVADVLARFRALPGRQNTSSPK